MSQWLCRVGRFALGSTPAITPEDDSVLAVAARAGRRPQRVLAATIARPMTRAPS